MQNRKHILSFGWLAIAAALAFAPRLSFAEGEIAGALVGLASAGAQVAASAAQADADKAIASINANAQVGMTQIQADVSKYQSDSQTQIALQQSQTAAAINQSNNNTQTQDLLAQLRYMSYSRDLDYQSQEEKRRYDFALNEQQIALATKESDEKFQLAKAQLNAQLSQAGLSSGFTNVSAGRPGGSLNVSRTLGGGGAGNVNALGSGNLSVAKALQSTSKQRFLGVSGLASEKFVGNTGNRAPQEMASMGSSLYNVFSHSLAAGSPRVGQRHLVGNDLASFTNSVRTANSYPRHVLREGEFSGGNVGRSTHAGF